MVDNELEPPSSGRLFDRPTLRQWEDIIQSPDPFSALLAVGLVEDCDEPYDPLAHWLWTGSMHQNGTPRVWVRDYNGSKIWGVRQLINKVLQVVPVPEGQTQVHISPVCGRGRCIRWLHFERCSRPDVVRRNRGRRQCAA